MGSPGACTDRESRPEREQERKEQSSIGDVTERRRKIHSGKCHKWTEKIASGELLSSRLYIAYILTCILVQTFDGDYVPLAEY